MNKEKKIAIREWPRFFFFFSVTFFTDEVRTTILGLVKILPDT